MSDPPAKILVEDDDGIVTITMNRSEKHNALDGEMRRDLFDALARLGRDATVTALVLRGAGKSFCSGQDLREPKQPVTSRRAALWAKEQDNLARILGELPFPVVAALHGNVMGRGLDLALAADLRMVTPTARLCFPEIEHGMVLSGGGMRRLVRLVGESRASEMMLCGTRIEGRTAYKWGLATRLADEDDLEHDAHDLARELAARPPLAIYLAKTAVRNAFEGSAASGAWTDTAFNVLGARDNPAGTGSPDPSRT